MTEVDKKTVDSNKNKINESYVVQPANASVNSQSVSEKVLKAHEKLQEGYIESLNNISAKLDSVDKSLSNSNHSEFRSLKIDESFNANAAFLHALYFDNIGMPESSISIDSLPYMRFARDWGTFDSWQEDFVACGLAARNGWVITAYNIFLRRYMNFIVDLHNINIPIGCFPVIALDCWEHTYFRDYGRDRKSFIFKSMQEFNWDVIEDRVKQCDAVAKIYGVIK